MSELSKNEIVMIQKRGINVVETHNAEYQITLTTQGILWLFNYRHIKSNNFKHLTYPLLKSLSAFNIDKNHLINIRLVLTELPVSCENSEYNQITIYLDKPTPYAIHNIKPIILNESEDTFFRVSYTGKNEVFKGFLATAELPNETPKVYTIILEFTKSEIEKLKKGEVLIVQHDQNYDWAKEHFVENPIHQELI